MRHGIKPSRGTCLQVGLMRALRGEVSRPNDLYTISILLDLQTFYDCCDFRRLAVAGLDAAFPPLCLHLALETYKGERFLQADGCVSEPITPGRGALAGCPMAPALAKLLLLKPMQSISAAPGLLNHDSWVDDLSLDFQSKCPIQGANQALDGYRKLVEHLKDAGLEVAPEKTAFLASCPAGRKALKAAREESDPKILHEARDLGIDATLGVGSVCAGGALRKPLGANVNLKP